MSKNNKMTPMPVDSICRTPTKLVNGIDTGTYYIRYGDKVSVSAIELEQLKGDIIAAAADMENLGFLSTICEKVGIEVTYLTFLMMTDPIFKGELDIVLSHVTSVNVEQCGKKLLEIGMSESRANRQALVDYLKLFHSKGSKKEEKKDSNKLGITIDIGGDKLLEV